MSETSTGKQEFKDFYGTERLDKASGFLDKNVGSTLKDPSARLQVLAHSDLTSVAIGLSALHQAVSGVEWAGYSDKTVFLGRNIDGTRQISNIGPDPLDRMDILSHFVECASQRAQELLDKDGDKEEGLAKIGWAATELIVGLQMFQDANKRTARVVNFLINEGYSAGDEESQKRLEAYLENKGIAPEHPTMGLYASPYAGELVRSFCAESAYQDPQIGSMLKQSLRNQLLLDFGMDSVENTGSKYIPQSSIKEALLLTEGEDRKEMVAKIIQSGDLGELAFARAFSSELKDRSPKEVVLTMTTEQADKLIEVSRNTRREFMITHIETRLGYRDLPYWTSRDERTDTNLAVSF